MMAGFLYGLGFSLGLGAGLIILAFLAVLVYLKRDYNKNWSDVMSFREYLAEKRNA